MKLTIFTQTNNNRVAVSPAGQIAVEEITKDESVLRFCSFEYIIHDSFDRMVENLNAELEMWRG